MAQLLSGTRIWGTGTVDTQLFVSGSNAASSTITGALQVVGGVGIGGNLYVGGTIVGNVSGTITTATSLAGGVAGQLLYQSTPNVTSFVSTGTIGNVLVTNGSSAPAFQNTLTLTGSTVASSTTTGALQVVGGVGIGGDAFLGGNITQTGGTLATLAATYNLINTNATTVNFAGAATTISIGAVSGTTTIRNNLTVGGNLTIQGTTTVVNSTVTNVADPIITLGGGANDAAPTVDDNKDRGVAFKWYDGGIAKVGFFGFQDNSKFFTFISSATITNEVVTPAGGSTKGALDAYLAGGSAQSLVYQSSPNVTAFLAAGTSGYILQTNGTGSAPSWVSTGTLSAGLATTATQVYTVLQTTTTVHYPTFVNANNTTATGMSIYTTSSFAINPATGYVGLGTTSPGYKLDVNLGTVNNNSNYGYNVFADATSSIGYAGYNLQLNNTTANATGYIRLARTSSTAYLGMEIASQSRDGIRFLTNATAPVEVMRLDASGNLGVGTTASNYLLSVQANSVQMGMSPQATVGNLGNYSNVPLAFVVNNVEKMRIDTAGNVGHGLIPSAWSAAQAIQIGSTSSLALSSSGDDSSMTTNAYKSGATWYYQATAPTYKATQYNQYLGSHIWSTAASLGVAGTAITFTPNMTLGPTGIVSIGTTATTAKLNITNSGENVALFENTGAANALIRLKDTATTLTPYISSYGNALAFGKYGSAETMRITALGGIAFGGAANYGSSGQVLQSNGDAAPTWVAPSGLNAGQVSTIAQTANASYYPTFVDTNNASTTAELVYTTSSFVINPGTGNVGIGNTAPSYKLQIGAAATVAASVLSALNPVLYVEGGTTANSSIVIKTHGQGAGTVHGAIRLAVSPDASNYSWSGIAGIADVNGAATTLAFYTANGNTQGTAAGASTERMRLDINGSLIINATTAASSTSTGALQVRGGVGVGGDLYAANIYTNGTRTIPLSIQEFTATAAQTTFTVSGGYTIGTVQVFANGVNLGSGDITASNGTTVITAIPRTVGDIIRIISGGSSSSINNIQSFSIAMSVAMAM